MHFTGEPRAMSDSSSLYQAVIFDMDGLLIETETVARAAFLAAAKDRGFTMKEDEFLTMVGRTAHDSEHLLKGLYGEDFDVAGFRAGVTEHFQKHVKEHGIDVKVGVIELLTFLESHDIPKALATSTRKVGADQSLKLAGLREHFSILTCGDEIKRGKPEPDIYLLAAERLGIDPSRCIAFEDSEPGIRAASSAGMRALMVPDLKEPSEEIRELAYAVVPSLKESQPIIEESLGFKPTA